MVLNLVTASSCKGDSIINAELPHCAVINITRLKIPVIYAFLLNIYLLLVYNIIYNIIYSIICSNNMI